MTRHKVVTYGAHCTVHIAYYPLLTNVHTYTYIHARTYMHVRDVPELDLDPAVDMAATALHSSLTSLENRDMLIVV